MKEKDEDLTPEEEGEGQTTVTIKAKSPKKAMEKMRKMTPQDDGEEEQSDNFAQVIKNHQNTILAERQSPTKLNDRTLQNEVEIQTPTNIIKIRKKLENEFGGKDWFVGAYNENGEKIGGMNINIAKPPKPKFEEPDSETMEIGGDSNNFRFPTGENDGDDLMEEQIEMEKKRARLKMYKEASGGESESKYEKMLAEMKASNDKLISEMKNSFDSKLTQIQADNKETVRALNDKLESERKKSEMELLRQEILNQQKAFDDTINSLKLEISKGKGDSTMELMFKTLSESQTRMSENVNKMLEGKISNLLDTNKSNLETLTKMTELNSNHNKELLSLVANKDDNSLGKTIETFKMLKDVINPPAELEAPMDFGSRIVVALENLLPKAIEAWEKKRETPEALDKSQIAKTITSELKPFITEVVQRETKKLPVNPPQEETKEEPTSEEQKKIEEGELSMTAEEIKKDTQLRLDSILKMMAKEMDIRPIEAQFVDVAIKNLPAEFMDKFVACKTQDEVFKLLGEYASAGLITSIKVKLVLSKDKQDWLKQQIENMIEDYKEMKGEVNG